MALFRYRWGGALGTGLLVLAGCAPRAGEGSVLLRNDFEQLAGWGPAEAFLTTEQAHSGRYALRVPAGKEYGGGYRARLQDICAFVPTRLRLQSWVYLPSGRTRATHLVVQVLCHGRRPDIWQSLQVDLVVQRYQKWERVFKAIRLPAGLEPSDELQLYVWHVDPTGEPTYFDDLTVEGWR